MALGKTPDELLEITGEAILEKAGGLPEEESHCAFLAAETVTMAVNDYMIRQRKTVST
jgi:nitrogen fixation NifU-like protein